LKDFSDKQLNVLVKCVTNTPIAKEIATKLASILDEKTLIIDITTHNQSGSIETEKFINLKILIILSVPVMGGPVQAEEGVLGGIVGATDDNFQLAEPYLKLFCKNYFPFWSSWNGCKIKTFKQFFNTWKCCFN
jgi:3-hydroxyisobutyrate dehydrogenase-like beta-hydroxyacid dehydrogenase